MTLEEPTLALPGVVVDDGRVLLLGGRDSASGAYSAATWVCEGADVFRRGPDLPCPIANARVHADDDALLVVGDGVDRGVAIRLDRSTLAMRGAPIPLGYHSPRTVQRLADGRLIAFTEVRDDHITAITRVPPPPTPHDCTFLTMTDGTLWGFPFAAGRGDTSIWSFDPVSIEWQVRAHLLGGRLGLADAIESPRGELFFLRCDGELWVVPRSGDARKVTRLDRSRPHGFWAGAAMTWLDSELLFVHRADEARVVDVRGASVKALVPPAVARLCHTAVPRPDCSVLLVGGFVGVEKRGAAPERYVVAKESAAAGRERREARALADERRAREAADREARARQLAESLTAGDGVEITEGAFKGFRGVVVGVVDGEIEVELAVFGRAHRAKLQASVVARAS